MVVDNLAGEWSVDFKPAKDSFEVLDAVAVPTKDGRAAYYHLTLELRPANTVTDIQVVGAALTAVLYGFAQVGNVTFYDVTAVEMTDDRRMLLTCTTCFGQIISLTKEGAIYARKMRDLPQLKYQAGQLKTKRM